MILISEWLAVLDPLLPVEEVWYYHLISGVVLMATLAGYFFYLRRAKLQSRVRFDKARFVVLLRPGRQRWAALNVIVYWVLMVSLVVEVVSGIMLFAGAGSPHLAIHRITTYVCVASVITHVALHAVAGGFRAAYASCSPRPAAHRTAAAGSGRVASSRVVAAHRKRARAGGGEFGTTGGQTHRATLNAHPFATALVAMLVVGGLSIGAEQASRETLRVVEIPQSQAPQLDGDLSDPAWTRAHPVTILTTQGGDFGGTHQSLVEIRALHDGEFAYFSFVWEDPTRSLKHLPLVKRSGQWRVAATREDLGDESKYFEDKFSVLLTRPGLPLIGAAIHLARRPLADKPSSSSSRGLHYTGGGIADIWQWRASHAGPGGYIDNCHFGGPAALPDEQQKLAQHYAGGFAIDPVPLPYDSNIGLATPSGASAFLPKRLPSDLSAMSHAMGRIDDSPGASESETSRWWMGESKLVAYSTAQDAAIPDGSVIPSIIMKSSLPETSRDSIRGVARWAAGRWTLEVARRIYTGSQYDVPIKTGTLMWVAAFDHSEKRHTRHLRPFRLEVD